MTVSDSVFLRACRKESVPYTPVWFMRQAGRSLPEYRKLRGEGSILDAIAQPDLAAEITLQPVRRYGVDAAILYSDIMVPVYANGFGVDIKPGVGPVVENPFASWEDLKRLENYSTPEKAPYVVETVKMLTKELDVPLIGFAGAPFTVASYLIEGKPTRDWKKTKSLMIDNDLWFNLCLQLQEITIDSLSAQIEAGASAVQLFDSWVGCLSAKEFHKYVEPTVDEIIRDIQGKFGVPVIYFGTKTSHLLSKFRNLTADVIGVDWQTPIDDAWETIGENHGIQGNLDPQLCADGYDAAASSARDILKRVQNRNGHIFNLGHGVLPDTDPAVLEQLVDLVHEESKR